VKGEVSGTQEKKKVSKQKRSKKRIRSACSDPQERGSAPTRWASGIGERKANPDDSAGPMNPSGDKKKNLEREVSDQNQGREARCKGRRTKKKVRKLERQGNGDWQLGGTSGGNIGDTVTFSRR